MNIPAATIDEYLSKLPAERAAVIEVIRRKVAQFAPEAKEGIKYGLPSFQLGDVLVCYGAQKHYFAFYAGTETVAAFKERLGSLSVGKGCIRFKRLEDVPDGLLDEILKDKIKEAKQRKKRLI